MGARPDWTQAGIAARDAWRTAGKRGLKHAWPPRASRFRRAAGGGHRIVVTRRGISTEWVTNPAQRTTGRTTDQRSPILPKHLPPLFALILLLAACGTSYSPDTYATRAVQQANKVEQGTVIGRRNVAVSAEGSTGAAAGAAAGGVVGAAAPGGGIGSALVGVGGALVGGLVGSVAEHVAGDTRAFEYVVRTGGGLLSVTQRDTVPLALGQKVLLIAGTQARIVPDYTTEPAAQRPSAPEAAVSHVTDVSGPGSGGPDSRTSNRPIGIPPPPPAPALVPAPPAPPEASADPVGEAMRARVAAALPPIAQPVVDALSKEVAGPR